MSETPKNRLLANAVYSLLQVVVAGVCLFLLYRFLLVTLGAEQLGIWSLVLATASVTQVANIGLSGGTVRFVAKYMAMDDRESASSVVQTAAATIGIVLAVILAGCYPLVRFALSYFVTPRSFPLALEILPFAMVSLWLTNVASVFTGGLEGCQRFDVRCALQGGGVVLQLLLCLVLAPRYGLPGVAYAAVLLSASVLIASWLFLKRSLPALSLPPGGWSLKIFKELAGYGVRFQVITLVVQFYDPVTKGLISRFGGLAFLGYYEMANRLVTQVRALVVSANQVVVPHFANINETAPQDIPAAYRKMYNFLIFITLPLFTVLFVGMPFISVAWIGYYEHMFVFTGALLSGGWFVNTLNAPAYFLHLGTGEMKWNLISHVAIGILNVVLGYSLGTIIGGFGPVIGWAVALAAGSCFILVPYHKQIGVRIRDLVPRESTPLAFSAAGSIFAAMLLGPAGSMGFAAVGQALALSGVVILFAWVHPARRIFFDRLHQWRDKIADENPS